MIAFGTGGWRQIIGDQFTKKNVQLIVKAIAKMMKDEKETENGFCIGYDRRFLSSEAAKWSAEVMAFEGITCYVMEKPAPTPLIMYAVQHCHMGYGMAVTASHNPALYNGIKVFTKGGRDANEETTKRIESYIRLIEDESVSVIEYETAKAEGKVQVINLFNEYIDDILDKTNVEAVKKAQLKVVLDPMYGVSQTSLRTLLMTTRCDLTVIHDRHDTLFGGKLPTPTSTTLHYLKDYVMEHQCDIGIATDGDADRIGVIDNYGRFLHPNDILVLLYYYLLAYKGWKGDVVRNLSTTHMLDRVADKFAQTCHEVNVGFKHISGMMAKTGAIIGGESSGGLTIEGHINGKDGIYAAVLLIEMMAVTGKKLSELMDEIRTQFGQLYWQERDFHMTQQLKEALLNQVMIRHDLPPFPHSVERVSYEDGCKVYFTNGSWLVVRFSGTEPVLRICCEMETEEQAAMLCDLVTNYYELYVH